MNHLWRTILRTRSLASVTLHRKPASRTVPLPDPVIRPARAHAAAPATVPGGLIVVLPGGNVTNITLEPKPYIHILFKRDRAEPWMTQLISDVPKTPKDWLADRGFGGMEYFDVKVGVAL
jgi:hypothetical protein